MKRTMHRENKWRVFRLHCRCKPFRMQKQTKKQRRVPWRKKRMRMEAIEQWRMKINGWYRVSRYDGRWQLESRANDRRLTLKVGRFYCSARQNNGLQKTSSQHPLQRSARTVDLCPLPSTAFPECNCFLRGDRRRIAVLYVYIFLCLMFELHFLRK